MKRSPFPPQLLEAVTRVGRRVSGRRNRANELSRASMTVIEDTVIQALDGEVIRGMPNLLPEKNVVPFYGIRVNASKGVGSAMSLPKDGREVLVFAHTGQLVVARRVMVGTRVCAEKRTPKAEELIADDLEPFVRAVTRSLSDHVTRMNKRAERYEEITRLVEKLAVLLGPDVTIV